MGRTIELSEHAYQALEAEAQRQGQTPEALLESLIHEATPEKKAFYDDLNEFFRSFGATEEEIHDAEAIHQEHERARLAELGLVEDANV